MSTFGVTKYNEGLYGVAETTTTLIWCLQIAWSGTYNGDNEAMRMVDLTVNRGRTSWVGDNGFEPFDEGEAVATVRNDDDRYWALNSSSPLYPYVRPGPYARLYVINGRGGTSYPVMRGYIDDIQCFTQNGQKFARLVIKHSRDWLKNKVGSVAYTASENPCHVIVSLLTDVNWPFSEWEDVLTAQARKAIVYYWAQNVDVLTEIEGLSKVRPDTLICNNVGALESLRYDYTEGNTITLTSDEVLVDATLAQPWKSLRNLAEVAYYQPVVNTVTATLWELDEIIFFADGAFAYFEPEYEYDSRPVRALGSALSWTLTVNTAADGSGSNISGDCVLTSYGDKYITLENNSGSDGYIRVLKADGSADTVVMSHDPMWYKASDAASIALYGQHRITVDAPYIEQYDDPQSVATWFVAQLKGLQIEPEIQIEARPAEQFGGELYKTKVTLTLTPLGITARDFRIGHIRHEWLADTGQAVRTTYKLEPYLTAWEPPTP